MKKIVIYTGYSEDCFNGFNYHEKNVGGTEIAAIALAEEFVKIGHEVYIFCISSNPTEIFIHNGVKYIHINYLQEFMNKTYIDEFIICRFIHVFILFTIRAKNIHLWLHDCIANPYIDGKEIYDQGIHLLNNYSKIINNIVILSDWHKDFCKSIYYGIDYNKYKLIGNGLNETLYNFSLSTEEIKQKKIPFKFTYCSCYKRGLSICIDIIEELQKEHPSITLDICWYLIPDDIKQRIENNPNINFLGRLSQPELIEQLYKTSFWFYPLIETETYCISALQAQACGCICVARKSSGLITTISDRGVLIEGMSGSKEWNESVIKELKKLLNDEKLQDYYLNKGIEWAKKETWKYKSIEWDLLFN
tara:strand:- start:590 stop:1675 length:1086 start_codon:yes stop_codon:yes gene_type:complete